MFNGVNGRRLYESYKNGDSTHPTSGLSGVNGFCALLYESLGVAADEYGRMTVSDRLSDGSRRMRPEEFSFKELAESIVGPEWVQSLDPRRGRGPGQHFSLLEAGTAIQPSAFADINAFSTATGGLLQVKILEAYRKPAYVADQLVRTIPSKQRFEKMPATGRIGDKAEQMNPGQPHPRAQFGERYVTTPNTQKFGLGIDVTKEAVFFDLTNEVLTRAANVGDELGLRKEKRVLDTVLGIVNSYSYNGTAYNTYLTSGNWINKVTGNELIDWTNIDIVEQLGGEMTDQESLERISVLYDTLLVMPRKNRTVDFITGYAGIERRTQSAAEIGHGPNPYGGGYKKVVSAIAYQRLTDADGANLSASDAKKYWIALEGQGAFGYAENWSLNVDRVNAPEYVMADQGLIMSVFCDEMGTPCVLEPRKAVLSTG